MRLVEQVGRWHDGPAAVLGRLPRLRSSARRRHTRCPPDSRRSTGGPRRTRRRTTRRRTGRTLPRPGGGRGRGCREGVGGWREGKKRGAEVEVKRFFEQGVLGVLGGHCRC